MAIYLTVYSRVNNIEKLNESLSELRGLLAAKYSNAFEIFDAIRMNANKKAVLRGNAEDFNFVYDDAETYFIIALNNKNYAGEIRKMLALIDQELKPKYGELLYLHNGETPILPAETLPTEN